MGKIVAITGNIGSGKTSLSKILIKKFEWKSHSKVIQNPYINDFYDDMHRWSFNMQVYYLKIRFNQAIEDRKAKGCVIQDKTIYEDVYVFAPVLHAMGLMSDRDFKTYKDLFSVINTFLPPPDMLIYLRSSVNNLLGQIKQRKSPFEASISSDYLQRLNERYEVWIQKYTPTPFIIDVDELDFVNNHSHIDTITKSIKNCLENQN